MKEKDKAPNALTREAMREADEIFAKGEFRKLTGEKLFAELDKTAADSKIETE